MPLDGAVGLPTSGTTTGTSGSSGSSGSTPGGTATSKDPIEIGVLVVSNAEALANACGCAAFDIGDQKAQNLALERYVKLPPSANEQRERLEQLRALDAGMRIDIAIVESVPLGVDTPEDLEKARRMLAR